MNLTDKETFQEIANAVIERISRSRHNQPVSCPEADFLFYAQKECRSRLFKKLDVKEKDNPSPLNLWNY